MALQRIMARAVEGRIARESPHGPLIPHGTYTPLLMTPYLERLLNVHGDIELEPVKPAPAAPKKAPKPDNSATKEEDS